MKHSKRRVKEVEFVDPEFSEALCEDNSRNRSSNQQAERKALQFCRQVQRALNLALADSDLFVEAVSPASDCGHLLVQVLIPPDRSVADVLSELRKDAPRLRLEVAKFITRKRAPELAFTRAVGEGGADE